MRTTPDNERSEAGGWSAASCSRFRIIGKWIGGGWWESQQTWTSRDLAEQVMRAWRAKEDSGFWAKNETMRVVPARE